MLTSLTVFWARVRAVLGRRERDLDFEQELQSHVAMLIDDNVRRGMPPEEARRAALIRVGGIDGIRERQRDARGLPFLDSLLQDLRYAFRTLRRDAAFTIFAVLIVGLGIGAAVTVFSVVDTLLLRPLPFRDSERLVWVANAGQSGLSGATVQVDHLLDLREQSRSFDGIAAYFAFYSAGDLKLIGNGEPERLTGVPVSENFFSLLGIQPKLGRTFNADECRWQGPRAVILSDGLWRRRFASDPGIVGRRLTLDDGDVTVVGVLPTSFDFPSVFAPGSRADLFYPFPLTPETNRWGNSLALIGRLKPGVTLESARSETTPLAERIRLRHPDMNYFGPRLSPLGEHVSGRLRPALVVLACAVGAVMLIVCANLSNLLLARATKRQREMAVRAALGGGRRRLIRQLLTESVVLASCGGLLGLVLAMAGTRVLSHLDAFNIPLLESVRIDARAFGFTLLLVLLTGLLFGLVPSLQVETLIIHTALKDGGRGASQGVRQRWIRGVLVVSEVAFACVLLVGAGLLLRSFLRVLDVDLGFRPERAAAVRIDPSSRYTDQAQRNAYFDEALRLAKSVSGVAGAGLTDRLPLAGNRSWGVGAQGVVYPNGQMPSAFVRIVSEGYLGAMGIPLRAGRDFAASDTPSTEGVILINETLARQLWPGQDAVGKKVALDGGRRVVGVVGDVRHLALEETGGAEMYLPIRQTESYPAVQLVVRATLPPARLAAAVRSALEPIEPNLPTGEFLPVQQLVDRAASPRRFIVTLLAGFSLFALLLASLGIYAVISYSVAQRTQEIGIRMALGSTPSELRMGILVQTLRLAGLGMALGIVASLLLSRALGALLFGVTSTDPATFGGMVVCLTVVAAAAGYLPARRASRIDPLSALRAS